MKITKILFLILSLSLIAAVSTGMAASGNQPGGEKSIPLADEEIPGGSESWWNEVNNEFKLVDGPAVIDLLNPDPNWTTQGNQSSDYYGYSVASAGDVNNDGYADVIVGAHGQSNGEQDEGLAYIFHGSLTGLSTTADKILEINVTTAEFGYSVSTAGDVNGDGYSDIIVGARRYSNGESYEGGAFVYYGSENGVSTAPDWSAEGNVQNAWFGYEVSTAGDVNNDGYSDVIVASSIDDSVNYTGVVYVFHGSATGLSATPDWTEEFPQLDAYFGSSVDTAGDVNGDNYDDVIIGAPYYDDEDTDEGIAYVYYGSASGLSDTAAWSFEGDQEEAYMGISVATAGNVNGDGYSDVIIGASFYDDGQQDEGKAFLFYGSGSGLSSTPDWTAQCDTSEANFGVSVGTAGDINTDGYADVIIGASYYKNDRNREGAAFVYTGSNSGVSTSPGWTAEGNSSYAYFGHSAASAGDVNGNGYSDVIVGAYGYEISYSFQGKAFAYYDSVGVRFDIFLPLIQKPGT